MYALYSKAFAKKAADLNKKEFYDKHDNKVTMKGGADGTTFEVNGSTSKDAYTTDIKIETKVDDAFTVSLKIDQGNDAVVEASSKISDALKVTLKAKNPDPSMKGALDGEFEFLDAAFSAEGKFSLMKDGKMTPGVSCGLATGLPGFDGVTVGANPGFANGKLSVPFAIGYGSKTFQLSLDSGFDNGITGGALKGWFQTNDKLAVAFEAAQSKESALAFKLGAEYKLSGSCTGKARYTYGKGQLDLAIKQSLDGASFVSTGIRCDAGAPKVCFTYNLE